MLKRLSTFVIGIIVGVAITTSVAIGVNFTVVLTQAQVDQATWKWNQVDPSHTQFATAQLFGADAISKLIDEWKNQRKIQRAIKYGGPFGYFCTNTWTPLSQGAKDAECSSTGDVAGCTICDANGN